LKQEEIAIKYYISKIRFSDVVDLNLPEIKQFGFVNSIYPVPSSSTSQHREYMLNGDDGYSLYVDINTMNIRKLSHGIMRRC